MQTPQWDLPTTPANSVEEAEERFLEGARSIKRLLIEKGKGEGRWGVMDRFLNEQVLYSINLGYQILTGKPLPPEFILEPGKHFDSE